MYICSFVFEVTVFWLLCLGHCVQVTVFVAVFLKSPGAPWSYFFTNLFFFEKCMQKSVSLLQICETLFWEIAKKKMCEKLCTFRWTCTCLFTHLFLRSRAQILLESLNSGFPTFKRHNSSSDVWTSVIQRIVKHTWSDRKLIIDYITFQQFYRRHTWGHRMELNAQTQTFWQLCIGICKQYLDICNI